MYNRVLWELQEQVQSDLSPAELRAWQALKRMASRDRPKLQQWRDAYEHGLPPVDLVFSPLHFLPEMRWTKRDRRMLVAYGFSGELARFVNTKEGARFLRAIQRAEKNRKLFPFLPPPMGAKDDPVCQARYFESCLFRLLKMRLRKCYYRQGHWFFAPGYHARRYCPAHAVGRARHAGPLLEALREVASAQQI